MKDFDRTFAILTKNLIHHSVILDLHSSSPFPIKNMSHGLYVTITKTEIKTKSMASIQLTVA